MEAHYTHTTWRVKLAEVALLLRDTEDPQRFVSFAPWESVATIAGWRALPGYQERVDRLRRVVGGFAPRTLEVVARR
jgi:heme-degrading monooxygenase HmoA